MAIKTLKGKNLSWHYLTDLGQEEVSFLKNNFKFHPLDLKDCTGEVQRSKIDIYRNYLFIILQLPDFDHSRNRVILDELYIFIGKSYLITATKEKLKFLNSLFYKIATNQKMREGIFYQGSGYLLYRILDYVLHQRWGAINFINSEIKRIETDIDESHGKKAVFEIAALRRFILQFKSILDPQRLTVNTLSHVNVTFLEKEILVYFDDINDYIDKVWFSFESYRDQILSLHEINESLISYRTNKVMSILTMFSVALLPLTFLTGLYGMNINLPFATRPIVVWSLFAALFFTIIITFLILKKKDWI